MAAGVGTASRDDLGNRWLSLILVAGVSVVLWTIADGGTRRLTYLNHQENLAHTLQSWDLPFLISALLVQTTAGAPGLLYLPRATRRALRVGVGLLVTVAIVIPFAPDRSSLSPHSWHPFSAVVVSVVVIPLAEELLYRGTVFPLVDRIASSRASPIVLSAACFSLGHLQYHGFVIASAWPQMLWTFGYGLVFGYQRAISGSILPSLATHSGINLVAILGSMV